jgi:16S rRNA (cytidine1402-2'-O)-methyltransferase
MLYIVATPIGNLMDISYRAIEVLKTVNLIAAEDTRHAQILLKHYGIINNIISLHENNEKQTAERLSLLLEQGQKIALISDAGTPLISDPGYHLVRKVNALQIPIVPIPGACAAIAALSVSGLATDQFVFIGFLPVKLLQKQNNLHDLSLEQRTMIFYEAPHRLLETIDCMKKVFGGERKATFCRELTKKFETIRLDNLANIFDFIQSDQFNQVKGEIVLIIEGNKCLNKSNQIDLKVHNMLKVLTTELPAAKAASIAAKITGITKKVLYNYLITKFN